MNSWRGCLRQYGGLQLHQLGRLQEKEILRLPDGQGLEKDPAGLYKFYKDPEGQSACPPFGELEIIPNVSPRLFLTTRSGRPFPNG